MYMLMRPLSIHTLMFCQFLANVEPLICTSYAYIIIVQLISIWLLSVSYFELVGLSVFILTVSVLRMSVEPCRS